MYARTLGKICKQYREKIGITQKEVAENLGYSKESISAFENGRTNNAVILLWYINHGLTTEIIRNGEC